MKRNGASCRLPRSGAPSIGGASALIGAGRMALIVLGVTACASPPKTSPAAAPRVEREPEPVKDPMSAAQAALTRGDWNTAESAFREALKENPQSEKARSGLGRVLLTTGRYEEAEENASPAATADRAILLARALRSQGKVDEARQVLEANRGEPPLTRLRRAVLLGEILIELGQRSAAEKPLLEAIEAYNQGSIGKLGDADRAFALGLVGRAAFLLRAPEDANEAFNEAEQTGAVDPRVLRYRAELFIDKHDYAHAEEVLKEALAAQPHHPDTLTLLAEVRAGHSLAFDSAELLAKRALGINPRHTGARFVLAGIFLRDMALAEAEEQIQRGLEVNPRDLPLLSMRAARQFLAEEQQAFEESIDRVLELSPGYSRLFQVVSEYAEWEHRYEDIERMMRRAVRIDPEDGHARAVLGLTLVRSGSDAAGVVSLRRAFELDPYNVRVLNTLDLYEKIIPEHYVEVREGPFSFRFPKEEAALLQRYVPRLARRAHGEMVERYGYEPRAPVGIELYATRDQFAVRTSGLPRTAIQGVCFGRKLATISPQGSPANLGMTLWHELAHVFHIGLSQSRVPRWLTEGLAEWETERLDVGWSRELDLSLYRALRADRLPHLDSMSRAFTRAERMEDISTAYYASGRIARWLVESRGTPVVVNLLDQLGKGRLAKDVVPEVLEASHEQLDEQFRKWLRRDLARFEGTFVSAHPRIRIPDAKRALEERPNDPRARRDLGLALLGAGQVKAAEKQLTPLVEKDFDPQAAFALARIALSEDKQQEAAKLLQRMLKAGHDGYEVRMVLARTLLSLDRPKEAHEQLTRAAQLDPTDGEPWSMLAAIAHEAEDRQAELRAVEEWALRSEHDGPLHRRHLELLLLENQNEQAARIADAAVWAGLADLELHRLAGEAHARVGDWQSAEYEWESALLCPARPDAKARVLSTWADALTARGHHQRAREIRARTLH